VTVARDERPAPLPRPDDAAAATRSRPHHRAEITVILKSLLALLVLGPTAASLLPGPAAALASAENEAPRSPPAESEGSRAAPRLPRPDRGAYMRDPRALAYTSYRNEPYRLSVRYPEDLFTRGEAIGGDSGRMFITADGSARFYATGQRNEEAGFTANELLRLSTAHYRETAGARVTYRRLADHWYVVSGTQGGRWIFYEKGVISRDGRFAGTLLIEYPLERKAFFDPIVTRMSRSFQPAPARPRP
jgi:hypothetical protein